MKAPISTILVLIISTVIVVTNGNELQGIDCGPVENLRIIESDFYIGATWDPPLGYDCFGGGLVNIEITINEVVKESHQNFRFRSIEIEKESCKTYRFGVQSIRSSGQPLHWVYETKTSRIAGNNEIQVKNLQLISKNILTWMSPDNSDLCDIQYIVNIDPKGFESTKKIVSITKTEIPLIPCGNHSISVTTFFPQSSNWTGKPVTISRSGPITKLAPMHGSTWPNRTGAAVNWMEQVEDNACEIKGIEFGYVLTKLKDTHEPSVQRFEKSDDLWYQLDAMEEKEEYSYQARWKLTENNFGDDSPTINFLTKELTQPVINRIDSEVTPNGDGLRIQWNQSYPINFVTKHIIAVKDTGCFGTCNDDKELLVWTFKNDANDKTVRVSPVFVNHRYNIEVQTIFGDLNAHTSDSTNFHFEREIERPGRIIDIIGTRNVNWTMRFSVLDLKKK